jgi:hypothetical protein
VPKLEEDRLLKDDIQNLVDMVHNQTFIVD